MANLAHYPFMIAIISQNESEIVYLQYQKMYKHFRAKTLRKSLIREKVKPKWLNYIFIHEEEKNTVVQMV